MRVPLASYLTKSQMRSILAGVAFFIVTLNQNWGAITGISGLHIPASVTALVQLASVLITMMSRSLDKGKSGTGTGIVGIPSQPTVLMTEPPAELSVPPTTLPLIALFLILLAPQASAQTFQDNYIAPQAATIGGRSVFASDYDRKATQEAWEGAGATLAIILLSSRRGHSDGQGEHFTAPTPVPEASSGIALLLLCGGLAGYVGIPAIVLRRKS